MNKITTTVLLIFVTLTMNAQEKLMRIDPEVAAQRKNNPQYTLFDKEKARLLFPQRVAFGVECIPSFSPEWSLTYDSVAHELIYKEAQKSIWYTTYEAMHKKKKKYDRKKGRIITRRKLRKSPKNYKAPDVKTFALGLDAQNAQKLKAIWSDAIAAAEPKEDVMLDGTTWIYFIGEQRAKARMDSLYIVKLTHELVKAVKTDNSNCLDSIINLNR